MDASRIKALELAQAVEIKNADPMATHPHGYMSGGGPTYTRTIPSAAQVVARAKEYLAFLDPPAATAPSRKPVMKRR